MGIIIIIISTTVIAVVIVLLLYVKLSSWQDTFTLFISFAYDGSLVMDALLVDTVILGPER